MKLSKGLLILGILTHFAAAASADPIGAYVAVAPSQVFWEDDAEGFLLAGSGFRLQAESISTSVSGVPIVAGGGCLGTNIFGSATACRPGDTVDMSAHTPGVVQFASGSATYGGVTYSNVDFSGNFSFTATPMTFPGGMADTIVLDAPFVFSGQLLATSGGHPLFSLNLTGTGTTERPFFLTASDNAYHYQLDSKTSYVFDAATASQTPEPASLLLLGTGLLGWAVRRHP